MKKLIFTLSLFCLMAAAFAQPCNTGVANCTVQMLPKPGLAPVSDSLPPIYDGVYTNTTIHFQNYDTLTFQGHALTMDSLTVLQITNLPSGLCWATNKASNTWGNQENGCIQVTGTTMAAPGQYQLDILINAYTSFPVSPLTTSAAIAGLYYFVRVNCDASAPVNRIDTTHETTTDTILLYSAAPYNQTMCTNVGVQQVEETVQSLSVYPNPFTTQAEVSFSSAKAAMMTEKITSIIGSTVYSNQLDVKVGANSHVINRNALAAGVYFYTITDGSTSFTKRLVITE